MNGPVRVVQGPRLQGPFGWAQEVSVPGDPNADVQVATWIMWLPNQGMGWSHFMLAIISLADAPGRPKAFRRYPQAEYELLVQAMQSDPEPDLLDGSTWVPLSPVNVCIQFHGLTTKQAHAVGEAAAWWCVRGRLPAETQAYVDTGSGGKMMTILQVANLWQETIAQLVDRARDGATARDE